jgi:3-dehydroquinate dehydratase-2
METGPIVGAGRFRRKRAGGAEPIYQDYLTKIMRRWWCSSLLACYKPGPETDRVAEAMANRILILNGPNLNLLGQREPDVYGQTTLADIERACHRRAQALGLEIDFRQSNHEGELVGWIQDARGTARAIILNAGAYTHTSIAILDALQAVALPVYEVHLSNIYRREPFRHFSYVSRAAAGVICGLGALGYELAIEAAAAALAGPPTP